MYFIFGNKGVIEGSGEDKQTMVRALRIHIILREIVYSCLVLMGNSNTQIHSTTITVFTQDVNPHQPMVVEYQDS